MPVQRPRHNATQAPEVRSPSSGEQIFRTRCSSCHTLGNTEPGMQQGIGPDLLGVTRQRDASWLSRWLKEPDQMLAQKDQRGAYHCCKRQEEVLQ